MIAAAGNRPGALTVSYPARIPQVIAVGSLERTGKLWPNSATGPEVDISAPGNDIPAAAPGGGYRAFGGTSRATAIAGGAATLILAKYPGETDNRFTQRLLWTTRDAGAKGRDEMYGWGTLDVLAALTREPVIPADAKRPTTSASPAPLARSRTSPEKSSPTLLWLGLLTCGLATVALVVGATLFVVHRRRTPASRSTRGPP